MVIYGVAILAISMLIGVSAGELIGTLIGIDSNIGGVGLSMIILIVAVNLLSKNGRLKKPSQDGIAFWSAIYIPIVVAMAAQQNVVAAIKGGPLAVLAGVLAVLISFAAVPILSKNNKPKKESASK
ncbi:malonate transporter subunit MadL [Priestia filamentosa]|uniref:Malonate transporter subunit MadL n=1 Tax=Priestia filamentosa TaxID=1402861 RepID=A0A1X7DMT6_9BACI|nr:malonate transporter subunit MadL [Priestia filamentosa]AKO93288.1 malonate transporter subunit MadL [Priestia filamentosa]MDT3763444.1 malonate transporter subunit MadL [Priestia filamentosa]OXS72057.1 malonate transporter subunit MadL [Priestia filamentosa]WRU93885.1 malonate transporter subunit MadL [Priestia filamentosa]SMF18259.1 malonate transporter, MadL subunit [Priestia filamentosa]